jgi:hypothetical protein
MHALPNPASLAAGTACRCFRAVQRPGEFVIALPRAYTSSLCHGFNLAESVAFALPDWCAITCVAFGPVLPARC